MPLPGGDGLRNISLVVRAHVVPEFDLVPSVVRCSPANRASVVQIKSRPQSRRPVKVLSATTTHTAFEVEVQCETSVLVRFVPERWIHDPLACPAIELSTDCSWEPHVSVPIHIDGDFVWRQSRFHPNFKL